MIIAEHNHRAIEMFLDTADPIGTGLFWIGLTDLLHEGKFGSAENQLLTQTGSRVNLTVQEKGTLCSYLSKLCIKEV